jgi:arylsulfatase A-like enzyme
MMHIPLIFRRPRRIPAGATSDLIVSNYDFLPTVLAELGLSAQVPKESPGRDFSAVLAGRAIAWENVMFYEMEHTRAIRTDDWKYVARQPRGPFELYDMKADPRERFNLYGQPDQAERMRTLAAQLDDFFNRHADPQYDVWHGGRSKAGRLVPQAPPRNPDE